jgi:coenzyme F420-reducing hydrogenase alpha subunit
VAPFSAVSIEGEIHVAVHWSGGEVERAEVRSTRPFVAPRLLAGKTVDEACALVPLLFSICGRSQSIAAAAACEAALGVIAGPNVSEARGMLVAGEAMQEYLFRALIDWPQLRGETPTPHLVADARRSIATALAPMERVAIPEAETPSPDTSARAAAMLQEAANATADAVLGEQPSAWLERSDGEGVERWAQGRATAAARLVADRFESEPGFGASDVAMLPAAAHDGLAQEIAAAMDADSAFERAPVWHGAPAETGALARMSRTPIVSALVAQVGRSALTRLVARLAELAGLAAGAFGANVGQLALRTGDGIGWVETARGLLVHRARIENGRVAGYRIVAPTEWNFHADGALVRGLRGARFPDAEAAERGARLLVESLDPCVGASVEVIHA